MPPPAPDARPQLTSSLLADGGGPPHAPRPPRPPRRVRPRTPSRPGRAGPGPARTRPHRE
ncbi:hypothetical protein DQ392_22660 [Streptomyces reniochalinae]|uniref:Uncharacterized protein n=1 Tax=Streptomyces reniochalinae TaxID=2250578 RepID=A0A367ECU7_9ACTN|nr:hypothetical protein DQ392_22660 [Streptomyces reniochalinae]